MSQVSFRRPRGRFHLPGVKRINWNEPITAGLSWLKDCAYDFPYPDFMARGATVFNPAGTVAANTAKRFGGALGGIGLVSQGAFFNNTGGGFAQTYSPNATRGSCMSFVTASFAPADSVSHFLFGFVNGGASDFSIQKDGSNNWISGWHSSGHDDRASTAASGTFIAGSAFVTGFTWDTTDTVNYCNGGRIGSKGSAPTTFSTSGIACVINGFNNAGAITGGYWVTTIQKDAVHWVAIWDRVLSTAEIRQLNDDPGCLFVTDEDFVDGILSHCVPTIMEDVFYSWRE